MNNEDEIGNALDGSMPPVDFAASQRMHKFGCLALMAGIAWAFYAGDMNLQTLLGIGIFVLSSLPALAWASKRHTWFPAFEISMLTCIPFYAVPLFKNSAELAVYDNSIQVKASLLVLLYTVFANLGFAGVRHAGHSPSWATETLLPQSALRWIPFGIFMNVVYAYISSFQHIIPTDIEGSLRALFFGIGTMSTFILARLWGLGILTRQQAAFFVISLTSYLVMVISSLYLIGGISMLALAFISYSSAKRKIPWIALAVVGAIVALLHLGKPEMRRLYWDPLTNEYKGSQERSLLDLPSFYAEWVEHSFEALDHGGKNEGSAPSTIFDRASLIQMICMSVSEVPDRKPYLLGESYVDIPAQVIPRFLWPEKPSSLLANIRLAVYFRLVSEDNVSSVSIAFGPLAEAYINFGYIGVCLLGLLMGAGFKRISMMSDLVPQFSALGIFMILLTAWSFQVEQVMATWLSSLFQASVICIGLPVACRKLTGA